MHRSAILFRGPEKTSNNVESTPALAFSRIICHFDVNKTIIATDAAQGKSVEDVVNALLAEKTFFFWDGAHYQNYYEFLTENICKLYGLERNDPLLKSHRDKHLKQFCEFVNETDFPSIASEVQSKKAILLDTLNTQKSIVFKSFLKMIEWLDKEYSGHHSIHLRTFGVDLPILVPEIEKHSTLKFSGMGQFNGLKLDVQTKEGHPTRTLSNLSQIHEHLTNPESGNLAIRDDYAYWASRQFDTQGGKLLTLNLEDEHTLSIFFDDNANDKDKPIIHPTSTDGELLSTEHLIKTGQILAVDTCEAILDENYFINHIKLVLENIQKARFSPKLNIC